MVYLFNKAEKRLPWRGGGGDGSVPLVIQLRLHHCPQRGTFGNCPRSCCVCRLIRDSGGRSDDGGRHWLSPVPIVSWLGAGAAPHRPVRFFYAYICSLHLRRNSLISHNFSLLLRTLAQEHNRAMQRMSQKFITDGYWSLCFTLVHSLAFALIKRYGLTSFTTIDALSTLSQEYSTFHTSVGNVVFGYL